MKKRNGFTLVELLAVIVVLALIMVIALPNVLTSMNKGKKESFYLYAKSLESKAIAQYTQDTATSINSDSIIYRIHKGENGCPEGDNYCIDLADTGTYDGWVSVSREVDTNVTDSEEKVYDFTINKKAEGVYYCVGDKNCTPNIPAKFSKKSGSGSVSGSITIPAPNDEQLNNKDYWLNIKYTILEGEEGSQQVLRNYYEDPISIIGNTDGFKSTNNNYIYKVVISMRSDNYAVENFEMSSSGTSSSDNETTEDKSQREKFYTAMDDYTKSHPGNTFGEIALAGTNKSLGLKAKGECEKNYNTSFKISFDANGGTLVSGSGSIDDIAVSNGGSSHSYDIGSIPELTKEGYTFVGWYYDKSYKKKVDSSVIVSSVKYDSMNCVTSYENVTLYAKFSKVGEEDKIVTTYTGQSITTTQVSKYAVTAPDGSTVKIAEYNPKTTIDAADTSVQLQSLSVDSYNIGFDTLKFEYKLVVPNSVNSVNVNATAKSPESFVTISGNENLVVGINSVFINVYNPNTGHEANYLIKVSRLDENNKEVTYERQTEVINGKDNTPDPSLPSSDAALKSILINGYSLGFKKTVYEYTLELTRDESELQLVVKPSNNAAYYNISGNKDLKDGSRIEIDVRSQNGYYKKKYVINIVKPKIESGSTKVLKYIVIGLVVLLAGLGVYISIQKNKKLKPLNDDENMNDIYRTDESGQAITDSVAVSDNGVKQVTVENNKPLGPSDYVGQTYYQEPVSNVFNQQSNNSELVNNVQQESTQNMDNSSNNIQQ